MEPELSHDFSLDMMSAAERLKLLSLMSPELPKAPRKLMGLEFDNPVGLAAGLDKNGDHFNALGAFGFGFVEVGTVTPLAQDGNPQPRLFRLQNERAIINRMGFNNKGVGHLVKQVAKKRRFDGILGINIGKNKLTPEDKALDDYSICLDQVYAHADYVTVNISSPNTPGLRDLQYGEALDNLLKGLQEKRKFLADKHGFTVPIALKVAPDNDGDILKGITDSLLEHQFDAIIATNTTLAREGVEHSLHGQEQGGLSGAPLTEKSTKIIETIKECVGDSLPIIGVGGIMSASDAKDKLDAGADLIQLYSGFIYSGPSLVRDIVTEAHSLNQ